jgi:hypothetical protein
MSNARVHYKMATEKRAAPTERGRGVEAPYAQLNGKGGSLRRVLEPYRTPCTLVLVLHEEAVNQHPGMAYWRMRGFSWFSIVHLVLFCIRQCFGS